MFPDSADCNATGDPSRAQLFHQRQGLAGVPDPYTIFLRCTMPYTPCCLPRGWHQGLHMLPDAAGRPVRVPDSASVASASADCCSGRTGSRKRRPAGCLLQSWRRGPTKAAAMPLPRKLVPARAQLYQLRLRACTQHRSVAVLHFVGNMKLSCTRSCLFAALSVSGTQAQECHSKCYAIY